jgi:hypothetical protein
VTYPLARRRRRRPARQVAAALLGLVATATLLPAIMARPAAAAVDPPAPLAVTIDTLSPAVVPTKGRVTITGEITNHSKDTWTHLQVFMFTSAEPITTESDLVAAARTPSDMQVGERLYGPGLYDQLGDLAPGQQVPYTVSVRRRDLQISGAPGIYWFGIHVLGTVNGIRDAVADGRARTFLPLVPGTARSTRVALVMPIKEPVRRDRRGRLIDVARWRRVLGPDGRLGRLLALSGSTTQALTWVVDPAVLDAARSLAHGNPARNIAPTQPVPGQPSPSVSPSPSPSTTSSRGADTVHGDSQTQVEVEAKAWLDGVGQQAPGHRVLALPYGDLDVASALGHGRGGLLRRATDLTTATMANLGLQAGPAIDPGDGYLGSVALDQVSPVTTVLLRDAAMPSVEGPAVNSATGVRLVLTNSNAAAGGPGPQRRLSALALRQRILAEAALRSLAPGRSPPLVVSLPQHWNPGSQWQVANFFTGLDEPWLRLIDLSALHAHEAVGPVVDPLSAVHRELPAANLTAAHDLIGTGKTFADLLAGKNTVASELASSALLAASMPARDNPAAAALRARNTERYVDRQMGRVSIDGPPFVMMSSNQGPIQVTVVNGLSQPVTVGLTASSPGGDLRVKAPQPITIGAGKRAGVRLSAQAKDIGVHAVTLAVTDADGRPTGARTEFTVRTSEVSQVVWVIMAIAGALLFGAIAVRIARRVLHWRARRAGAEVL